MAITTLGQTSNFTISYLDSPTLPNAKRRAQALLAGVEDDLATILDWFALDHSIFGNANRVTVQVQTDSLARNYGYKSDGSSFISVDSQENAGTDIGDDAVMALFIAELSEILMSYRQQKKGGTWNAGDSNGEGLSVFCAGMMHPQGYYGASGIGPRVNGWLTSSTRDDAAHDWVTTPEKTDKDADSYGCSLLFLYYLYSQLGYSIRDVIVKGGATLEDTYQNLTGSSGGASAFKALLDSYFPIGKVSALPTDNPFPLLPSLERRIALTFNEALDGTVTESSRGEVIISPYVGCPAKSYAYTISNTPQLVHGVATVYGFAQPKYSWKVNGQTIDSTRVITTTTTVLLDSPGDPSKPASTSQTVQVYCSPQSLTQAYNAMQGGLSMYVEGTPGHVIVNVECSVAEQYAANTGITTTNKFDTIDQRTLAYDAQYYSDQAACRQTFWARARDISSRYAKLNHIPIWQTLPDPPSELLTAIRILEETRLALAEVETQNPRDGRLLRSMVASMLHTSPAMLGASTRSARLEDSAMEERLAETALPELPTYTS